MRRIKPRPGKLPITPQERPPEEPSWEGISPDVRKAYEDRAANHAAALADAEVQARVAAALAKIKDARPPWHDDIDLHERSQEANSTRLRKRTKRELDRYKETRRKLENLSAVIRDEAFDDWIRRYVVIAERPDDWTQTRVLYENYLKRAMAYGRNREDRRISKEVLATETRFGIMMGSLFPKKRRTKGCYYPLRLKKGA